MRKFLLLAIACVMVITCFVGCAKQEDSPIIIDEVPAIIQVENVDNNLNEETSDETDVMLEMRQLRLQRLNSHISPVGVRSINVGKIKIPTRPVVPVPVVRYDEDLMEKIVKILEESLLKPRIVGPIIPFTSRFLYS